MKVLKDNLYYVTTTNFEVRVAKLKFTREFEPVNFQFIGLSDFFQITSIDFFSREYAKNFISQFILIEFCKYKVYFYLT